MSTWPTLDISKPVWSGAGTTFAQDIRNTLTHLRASIVTGSLAGYNGALSGGTPSQPGQCLYSKGAEQIKAVYTWGTTGGATGNVQSIAYTYSDDTGGSWAIIGTLTYTFDASGNVTSWTWS